MQDSSFGLLYIVTPFGGWIIAQSIKIILSLRQDGLSWHDLLTSGGMPSSHVSTVTSTATVIGLMQGFNSAIFGLAFTVFGIVVYDAVGVRRATGENSRILKRISAKLKLGDQKAAWFLAMGHTPYQVFAGAVTGVSWGSLAWWLLR